MSSVVFGSSYVTQYSFFKNKEKGRNFKRFYVRSSVASVPTNLQTSDKKNFQKSIRIGVLGASGYTGSEIVRLLANHPHFGITVMTADRKAGQSLASVFPHLVTQDLPNLVAVNDTDFSNVDAVFCCLPHGTTQDIIKALPRGLKIVDLSADFRLRDIAEYEECAESNVNIVLIGNKCDLTAERVVDTARGQQVADEHHISFFETSAKADINVQEAFSDLVKKVCERMFEDQGTSRRDTLTTKAPVQVTGGGGGASKKCC